MYHILAKTNLGRTVHLADLSDENLDNVLDKARAVVENGIEENAVYLFDKDREEDATCDAIKKDGKLVTRFWRNLGEAIWLGCPVVIEPKTGMTRNEWVRHVDMEMRRWESIERSRIDSAFDIMERHRLENSLLSRKHRKLCSIAR